ncbi:MAG: 6-carboxytetrahydropterin synthase [Nitrospira sp.]|jgi:6-pyruvoyltetrahydropterin/6-carboxytetrahydropterin synthase|nr:6-carboxytetrahydropterin synthase [Nitrospira sp. BO4]
MPSVLLNKRIEFAAAHRYLRTEWDEAKNRAAFGRCYNAPAHGHNYLLEVTVSGEIDPKTGMVVNLFDLKRVLLAVIEEFDHKNLNFDMPYFTDRIPTSENFAHVLWSKLASQRDIGMLHTLRLCEDEDLYAEVTAADGPEVAAVAKRYSFNAIQESHQGRDWDFYVTVHGTIDPVTGMVTDIGALDRLVQDTVIKSFDREDLRRVLGSETVRGETLAKAIWDRLAGRVSGGTLRNVRLVQTRDLSFDYAGG